MEINVSLQTVGMCKRKESPKSLWARGPQAISVILLPWENHDTQLSSSTCEFPQAPLRIIPATFLRLRAIYSSEMSVLSSNSVWLAEFTEHLPNAVSQCREAHGCRSLLRSPGFNTFDFK